MVEFPDRYPYSITYTGWALDILVYMFFVFLHHHRPHATHKNTLKEKTQTNKQELNTREKSTPWPQKNAPHPPAICAAKYTCWSHVAL